MAQKPKEVHRAIFVALRLTGQLAEIVFLLWLTLHIPTKRKMAICNKKSLHFSVLL